MHPFARAGDRLAVELDIPTREEAPNLTECLDGVGQPLLAGVTEQTGFSAAVLARVGTAVENVERQVERAFVAAPE